MHQCQMTHEMPEFEILDKQTGAIRYLEHGSPHWRKRIRWHYHDEYELHLIVAGSGKLFIGDYIGDFRPGCLVLIGPRLPHNWLSVGSQVAHDELRDHIVHFDHETITGAAALLPELGTVLPLLEQAQYGIEFLRHADDAENYLLWIKESDGAKRLGYFCELLDLLARNPHRRLLSANQIPLPDTQELQEKIGRIIDYVTEHYHQRIRLTQVADLIGITESGFSRFFRKATGNRFNDFVNRIRIAKACHLLSHTNMRITAICYEVGFNNIANFNRRFIQHKQMTPSEYRQQARQRYSHLG